MEFPAVDCFASVAVSVCEQIYSVLGLAFMNRLFKKTGTGFFLGFFVFNHRRKSFVRGTAILYYTPVLVEVNCAAHWLSCVGSLWMCEWIN